MDGQPMQAAQQPVRQQILYICGGGHPFFSFLSPNFPISIFNIHDFSSFFLFVTKDAGRTMRSDLENPFAASSAGTVSCTRREQSGVSLFFPNFHYLIFSTGTHRLAPSIPFDH